jgi:YD repeat-containing protein
LREYVAVGNYRGNVTTTVVPGQTINTTYDASGAVVARNDAQSHTVALTQAASTNYAAPGTITLNSDTIQPEPQLHAVACAHFYHRAERHLGVGGL